MSDRTNDNAGVPRSPSTDAEIAREGGAFPSELRPSLERVLDEARGSYDHNAGMPDWPPPEERRDAMNVQAALRRLGYEVSLSDAYAVWDLVSLNLQAGWLMGADTVESALGEIVGLCQDVAKGWDYAGISGPDR